LSLADVREIHQAVIEEFGGAAGIRDEALLESAVAAPQASAFGQSPFADLVEIAAAHLFYLSRNHPLADGSKRVGMVSAIVFLLLNGIDTREDSAQWEALMFDVAASKLDRLETTERLRAPVA
jgi:death-on-curing protein